MPKHSGPEMTKAQALERVRRIPFATLGLSRPARGNDAPYSVVVAFTIDDDWRLFFLCDPHSYKHQILSENPQVAVSAFAIDNIYLQAVGSASIERDPHAVETMTSLITQRAAMLDGFWPPLLAIGTGEYVVYRITLTWARVLRLYDLTANNPVPPFLEIIRSHGFNPKPKNE